MSNKDETSKSCYDLCESFMYLCLCVVKSEFIFSMAWVNLFCVVDPGSVAVVLFVEVTNQIARRQGNWEASTETGNQ